jgi:cytochrome c oxidase assembly factor CtaG
MRAVAFTGAWIAIAVALLSPLDGLADELFSAHMAQHLLLLVVAAPLLVVARSGRTFAAAMSPRVVPPRVRHRISQAGHRFRRPLLAWGAATVTLWFWHLPAAYDTALAAPWIHATEHASFLISAGFLWTVALHRRRSDPTGGLVGPLLLIASSVQAGVLGALLLFASHPLYAHGTGPALHGLTPLQDQQLAGALMWIPPMGVYLAAAAALLARWIDGRTPAAPAAEEVAA